MDTENYEELMEKRLIENYEELMEKRLIENYKELMEQRLNITSLELSPTERDIVTRLLKISYTEGFKHALLESLKFIEENK